MAPRREVPYDPSDVHAWQGAWSAPYSEHEALMQSPPNQELVGREELLALRERLQDAIDELSEEERWIFDAYFVRRQTIRGIADELGVSKSTVHRWRERAQAALREKLQSDPLVIEYLENR